MIGAMLASAAVIEKSSLRLGPRTVIAVGMGVSAAGLAVLCRAPAGGGYAVRRWRWRCLAPRWA